MFTDLELFAPTFTINCADLDTADEIYNIFRTHNTRYFVYVFFAVTGELTPTYLKVGESAPDGKRSNQGQLGERIVRQAANFHGYSNGIPTSSNGCDLRKGVDALINTNQLPANFDKNNLAVAVWDLAMLNWDSIKGGRKHQSRCAEGQLFNQIKDFSDGNGTLLNIVNPETNKAYKKPGLSRDFFESLFDIDE
jgi:hypothetical protein